MIQVFLANHIASTILVSKIQILLAALCLTFCLHFIWNDYGFDDIHVKHILPHCFLCYILLLPEFMTFCKYRHVISHDSEDDWFAFIPNMKIIIIIIIIYIYIYFFFLFSYE
jgi:hypothetical protein